MDLRQLFEQELAYNEVDRTPQNIDPGNSFSEVDLSSNHFVTSNLVYLFSGPPKHKMSLANPTLLKPVGFCNGLNISANKMWQPWMELGVKEIKHIPTRTQLSLNVNRLLSSHNNILQAFYKWLIISMYRLKDGKTPDLQRKNIQADFNFRSAPNYAIKNREASKSADGRKILRQPFLSNNFNNLSSEFFNSPFGLLVVELDNFNHIAGAAYLENVKIETHGKQYTAQSAALFENVSCRFSSLEPATITSLGVVWPETSYMFKKARSILQDVPAENDDSLA